MAVRKKAPARKNASGKKPPVSKTSPKGQKSAKGKMPPKSQAKPRLAVAAKAAAKSATPAKANLQPKPAAVAKPKAIAKPTPLIKAKAKSAPSSKPKATSKPAPLAKPKAVAKLAPLTGPKAQLKSKPALAREALKAAAMKKAIESVIAPVESDSAVVDAYMRDLDHPFKAEIQALRAIILGASDKVSERIKWNAPSFHYKEDLGAFHPRATEYAHLILLFPGGAGLPAKSAMLEGKAKERREAKFHSLEDIQGKKAALEKLVRDWVALRDA